MCFTAWNCFTERATRLPNGWRRKLPNWTRRIWVEICRRCKPSSAGIRIWNGSWRPLRNELTVSITCPLRKFVSIFWNSLVLTHLKFGNHTWSLLCLMFNYLQSHGVLSRGETGRSNTPEGSPGSLGASQGMKTIFRLLFVNEVSLTCGVLIALCSLIVGQSSRSEIASGTGCWTATVLEGSQEFGNFYDNVSQLSCHYNNFYFPYSVDLGRRRQRKAERRRSGPWCRNSRAFPQKSPRFMRRHSRSSRRVSVWIQSSNLRGEIHHWFIMI